MGFLGGSYQVLSGRKSLGSRIWSPVCHLSCKAAAAWSTAWEGVLTTTCACPLCWQTGAVPGARPGREALASAEQALSKSLVTLSHCGGAGGESAFQNVCSCRWSGVQGFAVQGFLFDVHPKCLFLVPGWPLVGDGGSDRQGPDNSSCKSQLQPSNVLGACRQP